MVTCVLSSKAAIEREENEARFDYPEREQARPKGNWVAPLKADADKETSSSVSR